MVASIIVGSYNQNSQEYPSVDGYSGHSCKHSIAWKADGWVRWLEGLRVADNKRMRSMCMILEERRFTIGRSSPSSLNIGDYGNHNDDCGDDVDGDDGWQLLYKPQCTRFNSRATACSSEHVCASKDTHYGPRNLPKSSRKRMEASD
ncbi:hypothetical protein PAAG_08894 [Paracoccidioides lutzii Pb01]|uniref:Uncharacterized protein n=1 Tax=Paracoccidioides lutzii (strain ATCC MYA-826 / Pb01) TaxID=502779 RepID=C1HDN7_PARBA|nr:hypothetical protein PAAG_08894 [Paracoccidioides lutzii Pb01]EEH40031.1 hypothetical protein PAAG_08894 [Paracoccidioides lutzii Pb01]